jgi:hypothetical protein
MDRGETNNHPSQGSLLLYLAKELPLRERREISAHLAGCWTCVAAVERLKQGIQIFIESRDAFVVGDIEVPRPSVRALRERIGSAESDRGPVSKLWRSFVPFLNHRLSRPLQVAAAFSLSVVALVLVFSRPPRLSAGEVLRRASASPRFETTAKNRWVHRTVRIRSGRKVVDWESYSRLANTTTKRTPESSEWTRMLRGPIRWADPLSVADFAQWREQQQGRQDSITESNDRIVLTTTGQPTDGIRSSSLTVRHADWHPIAKSMTVNGGSSVEVTELAWEVRDFASPLRDASLPAVDEKTTASARMRSRISKPGIPYRFDKQTVEIQVRDVLFSLGVGLTGEEAGFDITSDGGALIVEVATQSAVRKVRIQRALSQVAGVRAHILGPDDSKQAVPHRSVPLIAAVHSVAPAGRAQPLLWDYLVRRLGSIEEATRYASKILESTSKVRALSAQAHELSVRYPPEVYNALSNDARMRLNSLVAKVMRSVSDASKEYQELLVLAFDPPTVFPRSLTSLTWQGRAGILFSLISERERLSAKLFAVTETSGTPLAPEKAIQEFNALNTQIAELTDAANRLQ